MFRPATPENVTVTCSHDDILYYSNFVYLLGLTSPSPMHRAFCLCIFMVSMIYHSEQDFCTHKTPSRREVVAHWCNVDMLINASICLYALMKGYQPWKLAVPFFVIALLRTPDDPENYPHDHAVWHIVTGIFLFWLGH
jgi:hypothetical protein